MSITIDRLHPPVHAVVEQDSLNSVLTAVGRRPIGKSERIHTKERPPGGESILNKHEDVSKPTDIGLPIRSVWPE